RRPRRGQRPRARARRRPVRRHPLQPGRGRREGRRRDGRLDGPDRVEVLAGDGRRIESLEADVILLAVGARPRELDSAPCDGERILNWTQLYELDALPEHLIVVGSGVTGAEFASAYRALGSEVTLVSSRDKVLPGTDAEAADVLEEAFGRRGVTVRSRS